MLIDRQEACRGLLRQPDRAGLRTVALREHGNATCLSFVSDRAATAHLPVVEEVVDRPRRRGIHARRLDQVLQGGALDRLDGAEMVQQRALAGRADAGDLVEGVLDQLALALGPVRADGEAVRLVAQALHEIERRIARRQLERRLARLEEGLAAGIAVPALGDADQRRRRSR